MNLLYVVITVVLVLLAMFGILLNAIVLQVIGFGGLLLVLLSLGVVRK